MNIKVINEDNIVSSLEYAQSQIAGKGKQGHKGRCMQAAKSAEDAGSAVSRKVVRSIEQRESVLQKYNWAAKEHC